MLAIVTATTGSGQVGWRSGFQGENPTTDAGLQGAARMLGLSSFRRRFSTGCDKTHVQAQPGPLASIASKPLSMEDMMASEDYWKDKRIGRRQVLFAWAIVVLLAAGAQFADMAYRANALGVGTDRAAATAAEENEVAAP